MQITPLLDATTEEKHKTEHGNCLYSSIRSVKLCTIHFVFTQLMVQLMLDISMFAAVMVTHAQTPGARGSLLPHAAQRPPLPES